MSNEHGLITWISQPNPRRTPSEKSAMSDPTEMTPQSAPAAPPPAEPLPFRSVYTPNFLGLLTELGISLVVSTYQAGRLVFLRPDGDRINTLFRAFEKPMGV